MHDQTTKQRASRIDRNRILHFDRLSVVKRRLAWGTLAVTLPLGVWIALFLNSGWGASAISPGKVAFVHATWENQCAACHEPFMGIQSQNKCFTCHDGSPHFQDQSLDLNRCTNCHHDHLGKNASLVAVKNSNCVDCHHDLKDLVAGNPKLNRALKNVTGLAIDHPRESRSVQKFDPYKHRTVKFSHAVHMSPGMVLDPQNPRPFLLSDIADPGERNRFKLLQNTVNEADKVQLDCAACHRLDSGPINLSQAPPSVHRSGHENPLPITYDNQCKSCHALEKFGDLNTPHSVQPEQLRKFLNGVFAARILGKNQPFEDLVVPRPFGNPLPSNVEKAEKLVNNMIDAAQASLGMSKGGCIKCHLFEDDSVPFFESRVRPTKARTTWYEHAKFTHVAHGAVNCRECHIRAYPDVVNSQQAPIELEQALVPQVDTCLQCHGPNREIDGKLFGGARSDCVECHSYHGNSPPLRGLGAEPRHSGRDDLKLNLTIEAFLRGHRSQKGESNQESGR